MPPCSRASCLALAGPSGLCAAHAAGYDQADGGTGLRCTRCRKLFRKGEWYHARDLGMFHPNGCVAHPDLKTKDQTNAATP
jgi:hypothetical protein